MAKKEATNKDETDEQPSSDVTKVVRDTQAEIVVAGVALVLIAIVGWLIFNPSSDNDNQSAQDITPPEPKIVSYEECVEAGNPIMESFPEQCSADGETFTRQLTVDELTQLALDLPNPTPTLETPSMAENNRDVADDVAIWEHPTAPEDSVIIADNKGPDGGLVVYDINGEELQVLPLEATGNVDLRQDFSLNGESTTLVAATGRTNNRLMFLELDHGSRQLSELNDHSLDYEPYGLCMYQSPTSSKFFTFVTSREGDKVEQFELSENNGKIEATLIERDFGVDTLAEGCAADDELGFVYIAEEGAGLWKFGAEPTDGDQRTQLDTEANGGNTGFDLEGVSITYGPNETGFIFVSRQGDSEFAMYERSGNNKFVKTFAIEGTETIDKPTVSDGIDALAANLGPGFPHGAFIAHDEENTGGTSSNLKLVPLELITGNIFQ